MRKRQLLLQKTKELTGQRDSYIGSLFRGDEPVHVILWFSKYVWMSSCIKEKKCHRVVFLNPNKKPVGFNVTLPFSCMSAGKYMRSVSGGQLALTFWSCISFFQLLKQVVNTSCLIYSSCLDVVKCSVYSTFSLSFYRPPHLFRQCPEKGEVGNRNTYTNILNICRWLHNCFPFL